ncbi:MAG: glycosyltransferase [Planctomycetota bacterium]
MRLVINATAYGPAPGGAGVRARHLFGALRGHRLLFLLAEDTPASVVPPGAESRRLPVRAGAPLRRWLTLRLPADGDVVLTDHYPALRSVPTVVTLHDRGGPWWRRALIRRHLRRAAAVVAVSETVRAAWGDAGACVVPNGVAVCDGNGTPPGNHLLCCDPGLPHKGVAVARRVARELGLELREVGRGVRWLDHDALLRELAGAAAVLCPSRVEGFGLVPLEAMALGRPVVVSDLPAHREVCGDHVYFAAAREPAAWRAATEAALACPAARLAAARAHARAFTWERAAGRLEEVLASVRPGCTPGT